MGSCWGGGKKEGAVVSVPSSGKHRMTVQNLQQLVSRKSAYDIIAGLVDEDFLAYIPLFIVLSNADSKIENLLLQRAKGDSRLPLLLAAYGGRMAPSLCKQVTLATEHQNTLNFPAIVADKGSEGYKFDSQSLMHPFAYDVCSAAKVVTIFASKTKPALMTWEKASAASKSVAVNPSVIVKSGDDLFQDAIVLLLFRVFNLIWAGNRKGKFNHGVPSTYLYGVLPVDATSGYIEAVPNVQSFIDFDWDDVKSGHIDSMIQSAVGMFISGFLLGIHDRHKHNMLVQDSRRLLHIDFGFILGASPALDAPIIAISTGFKKRLKKEDKWETFMQDCATAYKDIYDERELITSLCVGLFSSLASSSSESKKAEQKIKDYLSDETFYVSKSETEAIEHVAFLVKNGSKSYKRWLKNKSHKIATTTASTKSMLNKYI